MRSLPKEKNAAALARAGVEYTVSCTVYKKDDSPIVVRAHGMIERHTRTTDIKTPQSIIEQHMVVCGCFGDSTGPEEAGNPNRILYIVKSEPRKTQL